MNETYECVHTVLHSYFKARTKLPLCNLNKASSYLWLELHLYRWSERAWWGDLFRITGTAQSGQQTKVNIRSEELEDFHLFRPTHSLGCCLHVSSSAGVSVFLWHQQWNWAIVVTLGADKYRTIATFTEMHETRRLHNQVHAQTVSALLV